MSTLATPIHCQPMPANGEDPYRYGWRFVRCKRANGKEIIEQVPLTPEDLLHPREGDCTVESSLHERNRRYLSSQFNARFVGDPTVLVLSDCRVSWGVPGVKAHCADSAVIFGVRRRREDYRTYRVGKDGPRPALIIELDSPDPEVRVNDVKHKFREYHQAKVPCYVIVDRPREEEPSTLTGYRFTAKRFVRMRPDKEGRLWLKPAALWIGIKGRQVVLYDGITKKELLDLPEATAALTAASQQITSARAKLEAAETRIRELEEKLRQSGRARNGAASE